MDGHRLYCDRIKNGLHCNHMEVIDIVKTAKDGGTCSRCISVSVFGSCSSGSDLNELEFAISLEELHSQALRDFTVQRIRTQMNVATWT